MALEQDNYDVYFDIDESYYPMINEDSIKNSEMHWEKTFPHETFIQTIEQLEKILSRSSNTYKKGLWIDGSFGTGKSRVIWTLKNLLDCQPEQLAEYFNAYDKLKSKRELCDKLNALKSEKIVTAYRYGSGLITSTEKLIGAVFESLTNAFKASNCKYNASKTLRGKIIEWLETDSANLQLFDAKIKNPKYCGLGTFAGRTANDILDTLKTSNTTLENLIENILKLGEAEGIQAFKIDMDALKNWITEVIEQNNLRGVIIFWDEFSDFFHHNKNSLGEFQKLVELSNSKPFYFVIATHQRGSLANENDKSFKTLTDRFIMSTMTMPDNIAFELIDNALKIKKVAAGQWKNLSMALQDRTVISRQKVAEYIKVDERILEGILPIHPIAALMLKNISYFFASNQRSMFNFIKNDMPDVEAFQYFIKTHSPDNGDLLTIDYLWGFFYDNGTDENSDLFGSSNLEKVIAAILNSYDRYKESLNDDERVVLKAILLMEAITRKTLKNKIPLLMSSEESLNLAFEGVDNFDNGKVIKIAKELVRRKILYEQPGTPKTFATSAVSGDQAAIDELRKKISDNTQTLSLIENPKFMAEGFAFTAAQKLRFKFINVTVDNFTFKLNRLTDEDEDFHIKGVICFALNEDEQIKMREKIKEILPNERYHKIVLINAAENFLGVEKFERWLDYSANAEYWRTKDKKLSEQNTHEAENILNAWGNKISEGSFVVYPATKKPQAYRSAEGVHCQQLKNVKDELNRMILNFYPLSFDHVDLSGQFFSTGHLSTGVKVGITEEPKSLFTEKFIRNLLGDVWKRNGKYWEIQPTLSISKLKIIVDKFIAEKLKADARVSIDEIFSLLVENGFMPCNLYALLTGFLLKEYVDEYRYSEGIEGDKGGTLTLDKLIIFITEAVKSDKGHREKYIENTSPEHRAFMNFAHKIFNVNEDIAVENAAGKIRFKISELGYPIWCYAEIADESYKNFIENLSYVTNAKEKFSIAELAKRMGNFLLENPSSVDAMKEIFTPQVGQKSLENILRNFDGGIIFELADKIGIKNVVDEVRRQISTGEGAWLWDKETSEEEIHKLILDYKIILASRNFDVDGQTITSCINSWCEYIKFHVKVPFDYVKDFFPAIENFLKILRDIVRRGEISHDKKSDFLDALENNSDMIREALSSNKKILTNKFSSLLSGWSNENIDMVISKLPNNLFVGEISDFTKTAKSTIQLIKNTQQNLRVKDLWKNLTHTESPREWSKLNRTPILALVPDNEQKNAEEVFNAICFGTADEYAIKYLQNPPQYFSWLDDKVKIDEAFRDSIIGEQKNIVLKDIDEVRTRLENDERTGDPYVWLSNKAVQRVVEELARNTYYAEESDELAAAINKMPAYEAKEYLLRLVKKNYEVGILILAKGREKI